MSAEQLTVDDALTIIFNQAQWCRENGETDMRNILNCVRGLRSQIERGDTREVIIARYTEEEDDE